MQKGRLNFELMFAGQADARVQEASLTGCARMDTVRLMQKGRLNFPYLANDARVIEALPSHQELRMTGRGYAACG